MPPLQPESLDRGALGGRPGGTGAAGHGGSRPGRGGEGSGLRQGDPEGGGYGRTGGTGPPTDQAGTPSLTGDKPGTKMPVAPRGPVAPSDPEVGQPDGHVAPSEAEMIPDGTPAKRPTVPARPTPANPPASRAPNRGTHPCGSPANDATNADHGSVPADDGQPKFARPSHSVRMPAALLRRILMMSTSTASLPLW